MDKDLDLNMRGTFHEPADITVYIRDRGAVLREKSLIAYEHKSGRILAAGTGAGQYAGRADEGIVVASPLRQGMVEDHQAASAMFRHMLQGAIGRKPLLVKPSIVLCLPLSAGMGQVDKRAWEELVYQLGAKETIFFQGPYAQLEQPCLQKYRIFIEVSKEEPMQYLKEMLSQAAQFAAQAKILPEQAAALSAAVFAADDR